jgi:hypothetical protein
VIRATALGVMLCLRATAAGPVCALSGAVVDSANKPVVKARVLATGSSYSLWKATESSGFFCFEHIEPGSYRLSVQKAGYVGVQRRATIEAGDKSDRPPLRIEISAEAVISGIVLDSDGDPIPGAAVSIWTRARTAKGFSPNSEDSANTGPDGAFRFSVLSPGVYYLSASHKDDLRRAFMFPILDSQGQTHRESEVETFYSDSLTFADATPLAVKPGQQITSLVLTVRKTTVRRLAGRTVAAPSTASLILCVDSETATSCDAIIPIQADGTFSRDALVPARYTLRLVDGSKTLAKRQMDLTDGDAAEIELERLETIDVRMIFRTEGKGTAFEAPLDHGVFLLKTGSDDIVVGRRQPDGTVEFRDVEPGIYSCEVPLENQRLYVKQVTFAGQMQAGKYVDLRSGRPGVIEVILSAGVARLEGHILAPKDGTNGDTSEETTVILAREAAADDEVSIAKHAIADEKGQFKLEAVPPGKYRLFAIQGFDAEVWGSPELAAELASKCVEVDLKENENKSATVRVITSDEWDAAVARAGG